MTASRHEIVNDELWVLRCRVCKRSDLHNVRIATQYRVKMSADGQMSASRPVVDKLIALPRLRGVVLRRESSGAIQVEKITYHAGSDRFSRVGARFEIDYSLQEQDAEVRFRMLEVTDWAAPAV